MEFFNLTEEEIEKQSSDSAKIVEILDKYNTKSSMVIIGSAIEAWCRLNMLDCEQVFANLYTMFMTKKTIEQKIKDIDMNKDD